MIDPLDNCTPIEKEAVAGALELMHDLFAFFKNRGVDGRDGLMKAALHGALFLMEEGIEDREKIQDALVSFMLEEFREDQKKP